MMDTLIEQKKGFKKKYISYVIAGLLLTLAAGWLFFGNRTRRVHVDRNTLNIQPVWWDYSMTICASTDKYCPFVQCS